jgi:ABC-2 type transport system permease protein
MALLTWAVATAALAALLVSLTRSVTDAIAQLPSMQAYLRAAGTGPPYESFLGFMWFGVALLLLAGYAVVQTSQWASQDQEGRLELILSTPVSRSRVVAERALEFILGSLVIVLAGLGAVAARAPAAGINIDGGHLLTAHALLVPFAFAFGGLGVALSSSLPRLAVPLLAAFSAVEYFLYQLAPIFKLPEWVANLSVFHLYGNPLVGSSNWTAAGEMAAVGLFGFGMGLILMRRREVGGVA